ncbi:MAG: histidine phosphatase family protein [Lachnospiraceae bacterium]|nr:histidine phosphatase family protein [Lachnospiraceae bacterium]
MKIYMIRHGATKGNLEHRYVGSTDEELLAEAREKLRQVQMPPVDIVYVSPLLRCRQTAELLYPGKKQMIVDAFRECDFGEFEYRNYKELDGNPDYQRFIDSEGKSGFPKGENRDTFQHRCVRGFQEVLQTLAEPATIALVVHGGTIMALLHALADSSKTYYDWQVGNGEGFVMQAETVKGQLRLTHVRKSN